MLTHRKGVIMIIPFMDTIGLVGETLECTKGVQNHLGSIHAGAQFTFAESMSGKYLSSIFPDMQDEIIPLLRESTVKYKKQALTALVSEVSVDKEDLEKFKVRFALKGRASIVANVILRDDEGDITCQGSFKWFVQRKE